MRSSLLFFFSFGRGRSWWGNWELDLGMQIWILNYKLTTWALPQPGTNEIIWWLKFNHLTQSQRFKYDCMRFIHLQRNATHGCSWKIELFGIKSWISVHPSVSLNKIGLNLVLLLELILSNFYLFWILLNDS